MTSMPDLAALRQRLETGFDSIATEIAGEKASSMGHHGRMVEKAMAALKAHDAAPDAAVDRQALLKAAAREVWAYFVTRESCGLRDHREVIRFYGIPGEVLARLGAVER